MVLGCVIVLLATAAVTAVAVLEQVHTFVQDISANRPLAVRSGALAQSSYGQPETLLMVGNDTRSGFKYYRGFVPNLANEMLLVRIDPSKPFISMLSLPRELWVKITEPNGVSYQNRLNSAYTFGTTTLLRTIRQVTGLSANHVIATTFPQFEKAVNKLGCVYATIDERYFHDNALGGSQYQNVDLLPGYQCLNGSQAEQFVSYRHNDTSQIRDARDQSFLLAVKQQYGPRLAGNIGEFEKVFGATVQTDTGLRSSTEILNLANLLISAAGLRVRQVHFQTSACIATCPAGDLTATPQQIQDSVHNFLFGGDVTPTRQVAAISHRISRRGGLSRLPLTPTPQDTIVSERADATKLPFTAEYPRVRDAGGSTFAVAARCSQVMQPCIRDYAIRAPDGNAYPIYAEVFSGGQVGQFYDVQGTTWTGAPLFAHPNQTVRVGRRSYELFYEGGHLTWIAWREYGAIYWVHNTLTDAIGNGELLAIAEQTAPVGAVRSTPAHLTLRASSIPSGPLPTVKTPLLDSAGRVGGLITLLLVPVGLFVAFRSRRRVRALRHDLSASSQRVTALQTQLATAAAGHQRIVPTSVVAPASPPPAEFRSSAPLVGEYQRYRSRGRLLVIAAALGVGLLLAAGAAYLALESNALGHKHDVRPQPTLAAPVAVLNAGHTPHAAHLLALELARARVHVVATANLGTASPSSYEILYTPGNAGQARQLAEILTAHHPRLAPIDTATAHAVGPAPKLVVVIP